MDLQFYQNIYSKAFPVLNTPIFQDDKQEKKKNVYCMKTHPLCRPFWKVSISITPVDLDITKVERRKPLCPLFSIQKSHWNLVTNFLGHRVHQITKQSTK